MAEGLYRSDVTFVSDRTEAEIAKLIAIETPSEQQYLTQIALEKPDVFARQLRQAREVLRVGGEPSQMSSKLRAEGFYSPDTQSALEAFVLSLHPDDVINSSHAMNFVMREQPDRCVDTCWMRRGSSMIMLVGVHQIRRNELLGPPEHQYVMQVAPNMDLSLWRFDAKEANVIQSLQRRRQQLEHTDSLIGLEWNWGCWIANCRCSCRQGMFTMPKVDPSLCARIRITVAN